MKEKPGSESVCLQMYDGSGNLPPLMQAAVTSAQTLLPSPGNSQDQRSFASSWWSPNYPFSQQQQQQVLVHLYTTPALYNKS